MDHTDGFQAPGAGQSADRLGTDGDPHHLLQPEDSGRRRQPAGPIVVHQTTHPKSKRSRHTLSGVKYLADFCQQLPLTVLVSPT